MKVPQDQSISRIEIATYTFVLAVIVVGIILSRVNLSFFEERYITEDGLIEWLTVIGFVAGGIVCFRRAFKLRLVKPLLFTALTTALGVAFIFIAGEEISWGQRIFGVETPEWIEQRNTQQEFNLHNLKIGDVKINKLLFSQLAALVMILYFAALMPLYGGKPRLAHRADALAIPIPKLHHAVACITMLALAQLLVMSSRRGELAEFGGAFLFTLIVALPANRQSLERTSRDDPNLQSLRP